MCPAGKGPPTLASRGWRGKEHRWQVLPEWASDDNLTSSSAVGSFDAAGTFTAQDKVRQV